MSSFRRKLAVVIPKYGLVGGAERFVSELTERIAQDKGYDVHVFANRWVERSDRVTFHRIPIISFPKSFAPISFAHFARKSVSRLGFDLIHAHERVFDADVFTMHGIPHRTWVREIRNKRPSLFDYATEWVERTLVESGRCMRFLSVSSLAQEKFLRAYDVRADRAQIVHPGVDIGSFRTLDRRRCREEVRNLYGIGPSDVVVLFVSMNFELKGLDDLMAALGRISATAPCNGLRLLVVGKGDRKKYVRLAESLGIAKDVVFAGVQREDMEKMYLACDAFAMLSRFDTFGMTVLEAMAASLPVIISGNVGAKDLVRDGVNGFVIEDTTNHKAVAERIQLLLDPGARAEMARHAFDVANSNTWDVVTQKVMNVYDEVLGQQGNRSRHRA